MGRARVRSGGMAFRFSLPIEQAPTSRQSRRRADRWSSRPTILIVEDEPEIRRFLRLSLGAEGYRVVESSTGRRGTIDAGTHKPDVAIVDLGLPDIDGVEVVRHIREWSPMPIIVLSAAIAGTHEDRGIRRRRRRLRDEAVRQSASCSRASASHCAMRSAAARATCCDWGAEVDLGRRGAREDSRFTSRRSSFV